VRGSLLFSNVRVNSYSTVENTVVLPGTDIGRNCRIRNAIIGNNCRVPEGLVVGENPDLDARRFHVTEKGVTLITQHMLEALKNSSVRATEPA
jgi:glucose-1-phosphate adenylyltransferase